MAELARRWMAQTGNPCAYLGRRKIAHPTRGVIPFALYPYQRRFLESRAPRRIVLKARQIGVSQVVAGEALYLAKHVDRATILFVSRNLQAAQHLQGMVYQLMSSDPLLPAVVKRTESELVLANGSMIRSLPATEETGRAFAATAVYLDEFAHMPWAERIYQGVTPCISRGGRLTVVSTPNGKTNMFWRLWQTGARRGFERFRIHWSECPEYNPAGYAERDPAVREQLGREGRWYRENHGQFDPRQWAEEFECDFVGSAQLVYREFDPEAHVGEFRYRPDWPAYVGQDFGYVNPSVALVIQVSPSEEVFVIEEHYDTGMAVSRLAEERYRPLCDKYRVRAWYCDPSGAAEMSELRRAGIPAVARRSSVDEGVTLIRRLLRPPNGDPPRLHIDRRCVNLIREMSRFSYRKDQETIAKTDDHGPDALRYFAVNHWAGIARAEGMELR